MLFISKSEFKSLPNCCYTVLEIYLIYCAYCADSGLAVIMIINRPITVASRGGPSIRDPGLQHPPPPRIVEKN